MQRRATKLIPEIRKLGLSDLRTRRLRGDLIQMYKLLNGMEKVNFVNDINFKFGSGSSSPYNLRRHSKKIHKRKCKKLSSKIQLFYQQNC